MKRHNMTYIIYNSCIKNTNYKNSNYNYHNFAVQKEKTYPKRFLSTYNSNSFEPEDPFWKLILMMTATTVGISWSLYQRKK